MNYLHFSSKNCDNFESSQKNFENFITNRRHLTTSLENKNEEFQICIVLKWSIHLKDLEFLSLCHRFYYV